MVNILLHSNRSGINKIFNFYKNSKHGFNLESMDRMLEEMKDEEFHAKLKSMFRHSKMTVLADSGGKSRKYHSLVYVEFLELLCRLAFEMAEH